MRVTPWVLLTREVVNSRNLDALCDNTQCGSSVVESVLTVYCYKLLLQYTTMGSNQFASR